MTELRHVGHVLHLLLHSSVGQAVLFAVLAAAHVDYQAFRTWQTPSEALAYDWKVAAWRWFKAGMVALIGAISVGALL